MKPLKGESLNFSISLKINRLVFSDTVDAMEEYPEHHIHHRHEIRLKKPHAELMRDVSIRERTWNTAPSSSSTCHGEYSTHNEKCMKHAFRRISLDRPGTRGLKQGGILQNVEYTLIT